MLIHPSQIGPVNEIFAPSDAEVAFARKILAIFDAPENADKGVVTDRRPDGRASASRRGAADAGADGGGGGIIIGPESGDCFSDEDSLFRWRPCSSIRSAGEESRMMENEHDTSDKPRGAGAREPRACR